MIKVEKGKDDKIITSIQGAADEVIPEFFSLLNNITIMCMHNCKDGQHEEFAAALKYEIDKTFVEAVKTAKKNGGLKMIRIDRKKKFFGKDEEITVELNGSTRKLAEEYTAIQLAVVKACIDACIPGKLQELKKGMHEALDDAFEAAETIEGEGEWETWRNL